MSAALERLRDCLSGAVEAIAAAIKQDAWVDQNHSPLGRRRHLFLVRTGKLPGCKIDRLVLVLRSDLDDYIRQHRVEVPNADSEIDIVKAERLARGLTSGERRRRGHE